MANRYRVLAEGFAFPRDPQVVERIKAGENPAMHTRKMREVKVGTILDEEEIPSSIPGLLKAKWIELVVDPPPERTGAHRPVQAPPSTAGVVGAEKGGETE